MTTMQMRTAYDSGRHYAAVGLAPNWAALWITGRLAEFRRGTEVGLAERLPPAETPKRGGPA